MSVCSRWGFDEGGYSGDSEEEDDEEQQSGDRYEIPIDQDNERKEEEEKNERKRVSGDGLEEVAKNVAPSPFRKFRRFFRRPDRSSSLPPGSGSVLPRRKRRRFGKFSFCYCLSKPQTVEFNHDDKPTDEDEASNSYDYIKSMIEKNDFYSRECNTHIDHC